MAATLAVGSFVARLAIGGLIFAVGVVLLASALRQFIGTGQDVKPWTPTPTVITEGIYRRTRNPMYVGLGMLQIGIGAALGNLWVVVLTAVSWVVVRWIAIAPEEAYLERKFDEAYRSYKRSVRRWV